MVFDGEFDDIHFSHYKPVKIKIYDPEDFKDINFDEVKIDENVDLETMKNIGGEIEDNGIEIIKNKLDSLELFN